MSEIRNGDVVYYRSDGRGRKFDGNLYILSIRDNSCAAKDENGKTHIFSSNHFLSFLDNAIPTGAHFDDEGEFFKHAESKSDDMTLEELLTHLNKGKRPGPKRTDMDVRISLINTKDERRSGQVALRIFNPYRGFDDKNRFDVIYVEKIERLYLIEATGDSGFKIYQNGKSPRMTFTDHKLYEKLKSGGCKELYRNWKLDSKCHAYYISLKEESV